MGGKVSRSKSEMGISLQLGSKWELRCKGGRGPFQTAAIAVCIQMTPLEWRCSLRAGGWVLFPHLQESLPGLPSPLCGLAVRFRVQAGENQAWAQVEVPLRRLY